jgi:hypothetical protein
MPVNSDLTKAQIKEFGSRPGGQRAATQGAKLRKRVVDSWQDTARDSPRAAFVAARSTASRSGC